jgi:hypothetical protein
MEGRAFENSKATLTVEFFLGKGYCVSPEGEIAIFESIMGFL